MIRFRLVLLAAALSALAAASAAPVLPPLPPAAPGVPCVTDLECETRFGAGDWFPAR